MTQIIRKMKIKAQLLTGFFLVLAIMVFISLFGFMNINTINSNYSLMLDYPSQRYNYLSDISLGIMDMRRIVTAMAFRLGDAETLYELRDEAAAARAVVARGFDSYEASLRNDPILDPVRREETLVEYVIVRNNVIRYADEVIVGMYNAALEGIPGDPVSRARIDIYLYLGVEVYADISEGFTALMEAAEQTQYNRQREIQDLAALSQTTLLASSVIGVAIGIIIALVIALGVTKPIVDLTGALGKVSKGDLTARLKEVGKDEIAEASRSYNESMEEFGQMVKLIKDQSSKLSDIGNNLGSNMAETAAAMNQIAANIQSIKGRVLNQSASVTETNATMESVTNNINKLSEQVEGQTVAVTQSSAAIEEMIANIQSVNKTLVKNQENVTALRESSSEGRNSLQEVASDIQEIARESEGLLEINSVMENIASQTNLLSMNAAIEAAHAGELGKGFAVVADEIRKLAESSSEQSKTIGSVLKKIASSIGKISASTDTVLNKFEAIDNNIKTVVTNSEQIQNAMEEQAAGSKQVLTASTEVSNITNQVKSGALEMQEGSKEVIQESKNLEGVTQEITNGMNEMATGAEEVNKAVMTVNELTSQTHQNISSLVNAVSKFKV